jgi:hypothetical protein
MSEPDGVAEFNSRVQRNKKDLLKNRITVEAAEAKHSVDFTQESESRLAYARALGIPLTGKPVPFGFMYPEWRKLVASMQRGDELWEFSSAPHTWQHLAGRAGIALVRNDEIVDSIITAMN